MFKHCLSKDAVLCCLELFAVSTRLNTYDPFSVLIFFQQGLWDYFINLFKNLLRQSAVMTNNSHTDQTSLRAPKRFEIQVEDRRVCKTSIVQEFPSFSICPTFVVSIPAVVWLPFPLNQYSTCYVYV